MAEGNVCQLGASVPTGLELSAREECQEVLGRPINYSRGKLIFPLHSTEELIKVQGLRSVDNVWVVVMEVPHFCEDEVSVLNRLRELPLEEEDKWATPIKVWRSYRTMFPDSALPNIDDASSPITFRVTCKRSGRVHSFTSMDAAGCLGAGLVARYDWKVQMKGYHLEVLLSISGDSLTIALRLNTVSMFKRSISHFGPTTLRSTIAYGLLRCANVRKGDIVVDPLCGGGSISIEGSLSWRSTYHLSGDLHGLAPARARANLQALEEKGTGLAVDVLQWDVCNLPLKSNSVDVIVTDMPFGKKCGSHRANWIMYPLALQELGRVSRVGSARAVILTHHHRALTRALQECVAWKRLQTRWINIGGLKAALYILQRTPL